MTMRAPNMPSSANSDFINRFNSMMAKQRNVKSGTTSAANTRRKKADAQAQMKQVVAAQQKAAKAKNAMIRTQTTPKSQVGAAPSRQMSEQQREQLIMLQRRQADSMARQKESATLSLAQKASRPQQRVPVPTQQQQAAMYAQQRRNAMTQRSLANMAKGGMMKKKGK